MQVIDALALWQASVSEGSGNTDEKVLMCHNGRKVLCLYSQKTLLEEKKRMPNCDIQKPSGKVNSGIVGIEYSYNLTGPLLACHSCGTLCLPKTGTGS